MNEQSVIQFLLQRGQLTPQELVEGGLSVVDHSRRNRNVSVRRRDGLPSLFVKQLKSPSPTLVESFRREAEFQRRVKQDAQLASLQPIMPNCVGYDPDSACLVFEYLDHYDAVFEHQAREAETATTIAAQLGQALALIHSCAPQSSPVQEQQPSLFPTQQPWILNIYAMPVAAGEHVTQGMVQFVELLHQHAGIKHVLHDVASDWRADSLTHNDLSWANVLFSRKTRQLKIIDWELVDVGDPAWDLGTVLNNDWVVPIQQGLVQPSPHDPTHIWLQPLQHSAHTMRALLHAYFSQQHLSMFDGRALLQRAIRCAAARAVLTAYESHHQSDQLLPTAHTLLDFASSLNAHADHATHALLSQGI